MSPFEHLRVLYWPGVGRVRHIGFYFVCVSSRVSHTNSERMSPLIYPVDPSELRIVRDQVSSWARPGFL